MENAKHSSYLFRMDFCGTWLMETIDLTCLVRVLLKWNQLNSDPNKESLCRRFSFGINLLYIVVFDQRWITRICRRFVSGSYDCDRGFLVQSMFSSSSWPTESMVCQDIPRCWTEYPGSYLFYKKPNPTWLSREEVDPSICCHGRFYRVEKVWRDSSILGSTRCGWASSMGSEWRSTECVSTELWSTLLCLLISLRSDCNCCNRVYIRVRQPEACFWSFEFGQHLLCPIARLLRVHRHPHLGVSMVQISSSCKQGSRGTRQEGWLFVASRDGFL